MTDGIELGLGLFCNREREDQTRVKTLRLGVEVRERESGLEFSLGPFYYEIRWFPSPFNNLC